RPPCSSLFPYTTLFRSVIVVIGMFAALASSIWRWISGVAFWLLYTYTSISWVEIWWSIAALSAAEGSVPSLMAVRNAGGVIRFRSEEHTSELQSRGHLV